MAAAARGGRTSGITDHLATEAAPTAELERQCRRIAVSLLDGSVVPVLGAGANLCDRDHGLDWHPHQQEYLPNGRELAEHLARLFDYPVASGGAAGSVAAEKPVLSNEDGLPRVSQYVTDVRGAGSLYENLHKIFNADYPPTEVHRLVAALAAVRPPMLVLTTNYDDALERAYRAAGVPYRLITYVAEGRDGIRGHFVHSQWRPGTHDRPDEPKLIDRKKNKCADLLADGVPVIAKIHGTVRRGQGFHDDSYVITETDFVDYLTDSDVWNVLPAPVAAKLKESHLLFMGYGLRDWNLRVMLHRAWSQQLLKLESWAIRDDADAVDVTLWQHRMVTTLVVKLKPFVAALVRSFAKVFLEQLWHLRPEERRKMIEALGPDEVGVGLFTRTFLDDPEAVADGIPQEHLDAFVETLLATQRGRALTALSGETLDALPAALQARIRTAGP
jgi:SIR2-like domain